MAQANDYMLKADRDHKAAMFDKQRQRWQEKRARGKPFYILYDSLLISGGILFLALSAWDAILLYRNLRELPERLIVNAIVVGLLGFLAGEFEWRWNERRFQNATRYTVR
jgi:hypothetical protein